MTDTYNSYTMSVQTFRTIEKERLPLPVTVDAAVINNIISKSYLYGLQIIIFFMYKAMVHKILFF